MIIISTTVGKYPLEENLKNNRMISVHFQGKSFNVTVIQVYAPISNAGEAEVGWFYEDLQDLLELTLKKDVLFITGDWNTKVGSREIWGKGWRLPGIRPLPTFWSLMVSLGTVKALVDMSLSICKCVTNECILRLKV